MNNIALNLIKSYLPYLLSFLLGVLVAWKGCGGGGSVTETVEVKAPVFVTEYVDKWKTDTVRYVDTRIVNVYDTVTNSILTVDTIYNVDTISIVEAWLTEVNKYDTLISFTDASVALKWQNYQNRTEDLKITYTPKKVAGAKFALGIHGNAGLVSDFKSRYVPLFGIGANIKVNRIYFGPGYGYNGDHYLNLHVGATILEF
jgi:hypothetical protein